MRSGGGRVHQLSLLRSLNIHLMEAKIIYGHDMIPVVTVKLITKKESATLVDKSIFVRRQISTFGRLIVRSNT